MLDVIELATGTRRWEDIHDFFTGEEWQKTGIVDEIDDSDVDCQPGIHVGLAQAAVSAIGRLRPLVTVAAEIEGKWPRFPSATMPPWKRKNRPSW
jgi:hypothetical protein